MEVESKPYELPSPPLFPHLGYVFTDSCCKRYETSYTRIYTIINYFYFALNFSSFHRHRLLLLYFVLPIFFNSYFLRVCFTPISHERRPFGFFPIYPRSATAFTCQVPRFSYHTFSNHWTLYRFIKGIILGTPIVFHWVSNYSRLFRYRPSLSSYKMIP